MANEMNAHVKTEKGILLREHETIDQAKADAEKSNKTAAELGVKANYQAAEGAFPRS